MQLLTYYNNHNPDKPVRIVMMYLQPKSINQKQDTYLHSLLDSNITPNIILKYNGALTATTFITDLDKKNVHEKHFIKLSKQPLDAIATYIQYN
ncbi:hypothetical protein FACS1894166_08110 [Bacilli bacterium]|nr:hypothetical protein FACS1894166_08110 [Bacilli bacterium]